MLNISQARNDGSLSLYLSNNSLTGGLAYLAWKRLSVLNISSNMVQESPPIFAANLPLKALYASNNRLNGSIDPSICQLENLIILDLSNNTLVGKTPQCLGNTNTQLLVLNLQTNHLNDIIPPNLLKCDSLSYLNLGNNKLEGEVPHSLSQCKNLRVLNLASNKLMHTFPSWLGSLPKLQVLSLCSNGLYGSVTSSNLVTRSFPELQIFDLSNNNLTGLLPMRYINSFRALMNVKSPVGNPQYLGFYNFHYSYSIALTFNGIDIEYEKIITTLSTFDLSNNKFDGEIPDSIGRLVSLRGLNLSFNHLQGPIPPSLGNLSQLDCLDLSSNMLTGGIPQELSHLTFLGAFNVSENRLVGHIPSGMPFDTFSADSYRGNLGLCGRPLIECGGNNPSTHNPSENNDIANDNNDETGIILEKEIVMMGYGCGTLVGLAWGCCMFLIGKPSWFIRLANSLELIVLNLCCNKFDRIGRRIN